MGRGRGKNGRKGTGNKKHKWWVQNRQGKVKNIMGNGEAKELICMTHGHELKGGNVGRKRCAEWRGIKGRKKWDNCNIIINKIYFKIMKKEMSVHIILKIFLKPSSFKSNR